MTPSPASFLLWLSLLVFVLPATSQLLEDITSSFLRGRSLLESFWVLPFGMQWLLTVSNQAGLGAREATPEEEDGIRQATEDWFASEIPDIYADETSSFQFQNISCTIFDTTYDGEWRHTILMDCSVIFSGDDVADLPGNEQFLLDMNLPVGRFRGQHLLTSETTGMFKFSSRVGYITTNLGDWIPATDFEEDSNSTSILTNYTNTTNATAP